MLNREYFKNSIDKINGLAIDGEIPLLHISWMLNLYTAIKLNEYNEREKKVTYNIYDINGAYKVKITFNDVFIWGDFNISQPCFDFSLEMDKGGNPYLVFQQLTDEFQAIKITLYYSNITEEIIPTNYLRNNYYDDNDFLPWANIALSIYTLENKIKFCGEEYTTELEKELVKLSGVNPIMNYYTYRYEDCFDIEGVKQLLVYIKEINSDNSVLKYLEELVTDYCKACDENEMIQIEKYISKIMQKTELKCIFELISSKFIEATNDYVSLAELEFGQAKLNVIRKTIHNTLFESGYTGCYPQYYKPTLLRGMNIVDVKPQSQLLWNEKEVGAFITVSEQFGVFPMDDDEEILDWGIRIVFNCGTAIYRNKKAKDINDYRIESLCYEKKLWRVVNRTMVIEMNHDKEDINIDYLRKGTIIAAKKSECKRISSREEEECRMGTSKEIFSWIDMLVHIIGGLLFSIIFCTLFSIVAVGLSMVEGQTLNEAIEELKIIPWKPAIIVIAIAFGLPMYIITKKSK